MGFRDFVDPGGRRMSRRIDQLRDTFDQIGERLRGTIADALGQTLSGIVRDTALKVLDHIAGYLPGPVAKDAVQEQEPARNIWLDQEEQSEPESYPAGASSERVATAVSAGMYVASLWLRRWTGKSRSLTTAVVGVVAAGVAYVGGPIAATVLSLAGIAGEFTAITDAISSDHSAVRFFDPA